MQWWHDRYRSYRMTDNTFQPDTGRAARWLAV
ncbi:BA14K family protein [Tianweitania sediminis]